MFALTQCWPQCSCVRMYVHNKSMYVTPAEVHSTIVNRHYWQVVCQAGMAPCMLLAIPILLTQFSFITSVFYHVCMFCAVHYVLYPFNCMLFNFLAIPISLTQSSFYLLRCFIMYVCMFCVVLFKSGPAWKAAIIADAVFQSINQSIIIPCAGVTKKGICKFMKELRI